MEDQIKSLPKQLIEGYKLAANTGEEYKEEEFDNIIVAGMGGSALPGNVLKAASENLDINIPVFVHKSYGLPHRAGEKSLIVVISYSGNTEEALSAYERSIELEASTVVITTGGKLAQKASKHNTPTINIPSGVQPRMAVGYQFSSLLAVLSNVNIIPSQKKKLESASNSLNAEEGRKNAKNMAQDIHGTLPIFYSSEKLKKVTYILKIQINENAKQHAFYNFFPEMNHNELEGFESKNNNNVSVIFINDKSDLPRIKKRMELTSELIKDRGYPVHTIDSGGNNWYSKVFSLVLFGSWLSYYLAVENNTEPEKVDLIEEFKRSLR